MSKNAPKIIIHRGSQTIGGSCIEIQSGGHRIIMDLGSPLMNSDESEVDQELLKKPSIENGVLPDIQGLYVHQTPLVDAVILSHSHSDHHGLMDYIHPEIPIYLSKESQVLIEVGNIFYHASNVHKKMLTHCQNFTHRKAFSIGNFKITSYLMDHSAFGASSLSVEVAGKKIFYTGDFRGHGRKTKVFDALIANPLLKDLDCLLMEGTTLGGNHPVAFPTEQDVEKQMFQEFSTQQDASFIMSAGSNIDRLISIYKAVKRSKKVLVLDLYQFYLLNQLKQFSPRLPPHPEDEIRVLYTGGHCQKLVECFGQNILYKREYVSRKINQDEILKRRKDMVIRLSSWHSMEGLAKAMGEKVSLEKSKLIYSMWSGYRKQKPKFDKFCTQYHIPIKEIHTSGHAYLQDLKRLVDAFTPKVLLPIHTVSGDDFETHFDHVIRGRDGEVFEM